MYSLLIVDDEPDIVDSIADDLPWGDIGITKIYRACDGEQALKLAAENPMDVVLTDIQMPKRSGILLAQELRQRFRHTKIIFMTGYDRFEYAQEAVRHGVYRYILKPASNDELLRGVASALDEVRSEIEKRQAFEKIERQLGMARPFILQRVMNEYIVAGRIGARQAMAMVEAAGAPIEHNEYFLVLILRVDRPGEPKDAEKDRIALQKLIEKLLPREEPFLFEDLDFNTVLLLHGNDRASLTQAAKGIEERWGLFHSAVNQPAGFTASLFMSESLGGFGELHTLYLAVREKMLRAQPADDGGLTNSGSRVVEQAKQRVIRSNLGNISVAELANQLCISPSHLTRVFKHETGQSVIEYILERKIAHAKEMLTQPGIKVYEVAQALGYHNLSHFNRIFHRLAGCTPKEYQMGKRRLLHQFPVPEHPHRGEGKFRN